MNDFEHVSIESTDLLISIEKVDQIFNEKLNVFVYVNLMSLVNEVYEYNSS